MEKPLLAALAKVVSCPWEQNTGRSGARPRKEVGTAGSAPLSAFFRRDLVDRPMPPHRRPVMGISNWGEARMQFLLKAMAESTGRQYESAWTKWFSFVDYRDLPPFLSRAGSADDLREEENLLIDFAITMNEATYAPATIRNTLSGVRFQHVVNGYPDPLLGRPRLTLLLRSIKKQGGITLKKFPITARMMRWMHWALSSDEEEAQSRREVAGLEKEDCVIVWAGFCQAWNFLLRGGEWLAHDGRGYDLPKVVIGEGIKPMTKEAATICDWSDAQQVALEVRSSKVDVYNVGTWRNHYSSGEVICPVESLKAMQKMFPERFRGGDESHLPLFRRASGRPLWRSNVQSIVDWAAEKEGMPSTRFGSHSFRIGGATALLHAGVPIEIIKRWGRWASDSFQRYLWDANEDAKGLSTRMATDNGTLVSSR
jgi:hypothetical protein